MTLCGPFGTNLDILGVLNVSFPPFFRNIGGCYSTPSTPSSVEPDMEPVWGRKQPSDGFHYTWDQCYHWFKGLGGRKSNLLGSTQSVVSAVYIVSGFELNQEIGIIVLIPILSLKFWLPGSGFCQCQPWTWGKISKNKGFLTVCDQSNKQNSKVFSTKLDLWLISQQKLIEVYGIRQIIELCTAIPVRNGTLTK